MNMQGQNAYLNIMHKLFMMRDRSNEGEMELWVVIDLPFGTHIFRLKVSKGFKEIPDSPSGCRLFKLICF